MSWLGKLMITNVMLLSVFLGVSSNSFLVSWAAMELNLMALVPFMVFSNFYKNSGSALKFFVIQALGGMMVLIFLFLLNINQGGVWGLFVLNLIFLFKLGAFPFYSWSVKLGKSLDWESLFLMLTIQKIIPLFFMYILGMEKLLIISAIGWGVLIGVSLLTKSVKSLFIFSSIFFLMSILISGLLDAWKWKVFLTLYLFMFLPIVYFTGGESSFMNTGNTKWGVVEKSLWLMLVLNLSGIPPFPGFLFKLDFTVLLLTAQEWVLGLVFVILSVGMVYLYTTILFSVVVKGGAQLFSSRKKKIMSFVFSSFILSVIWLI